MKKVAVVNGAYGGMGFQIVKDLVKEDYFIVMLGKNHEKLLNAYNLVNSKDKLMISSDMLDTQNHKKISQVLLDKDITPDLFVNACGIVEIGFLNEIDESVWSNAFQINLLGVINLVKEMTNLMLNNKNGLNRNIILINGALSKTPKPELIVNSTITGAITNFAKALSKDMAKERIRVNIINPSLTRTGLLESIKQRVCTEFGITAEMFEQNAINGSPLGAINEPSDISELVVFLASSKAKQINGIAINIDAGSTECI